MALVAYEYSDEDLSDSDEEETPRKKLKENDVISSSDDKKESILSKPSNVGLKGVGLDISWSLLDKHRIQPIRIPMTTFVEDEREDKSKMPKVIASKKGAGLFSMLPKPKSEMVSNTVKTTLKPTSVMRPKPVPKPKPKVVQKVKKDSDSESDSESSSFFFTPETDIKVDPKTAQQIAKELSDIEDKVAKSMEKPIEEDPVEEVLPEDNPTVERNTVAELSDEVLAKLCGTKDRRTAIPDEFIDVDGSALVGDSKQWLMKELSKEQPNTQKFEGPLNAKRKHQITYLAAHAKANELELQNQWSNNRMTRKQTQAKYGF